MNEYWSVSIDDIVEELYNVRSGVKGGHYIGFLGSKDDVCVLIAGVLWRKYVSIN